MKIFGSLSEQNIIDIENSLGIKLPEDYQKFLRNTNGGVFEQVSIKPIKIKSENIEIYLDVFFGLVDANNSNLLYWNKKYSDEMMGKSILIGFDLMQGFIVLINDGENNGIYYWDDSYNFKSSNDENNMYFIANDFLHLYKMVTE